VQGLMVGALVEPIERLPPGAPTPKRALMQRAFRHRKIIERSQRVTGVIGPSVHSVPPQPREEHEQDLDAESLEAAVRFLNAIAHPKT